MANRTLDTTEATVLDWVGGRVFEADEDEYIPLDAVKRAIRVITQLAREAQQPTKTEILLMLDAPEAQSYADAARLVAVDKFLADTERLQSMIKQELDLNKKKAMISELMALVETLPSTKAPASPPKPKLEKKPQPVKEKQAAVAKEFAVTSERTGISVKELSEHVRDDAHASKYGADALACWRSMKGVPGDAVRVIDIINNHPMPPTKKLPPTPNKPRPAKPGPDSIMYEMRDGERVKIGFMWRKGLIKPIKLNGRVTFEAVKLKPGSEDANRFIRLMVPVIGLADNETVALDHGSSDTVTTGRVLSKTTNWHGEDEGAESTVTGTVEPTPAGFRRAEIATVTAASS